MTAGVQKPGPRVGRLSRLKLTEPVIFYAGPSLLLLAIAVLGPVVVSRSWLALAVLLPLLALHGLSLWCVRASCYSPAGMMRALRDAFENR